MNLQQLVVRLTGVDLDGFEVKGYRQHLHGDTLTITREDASALKAAYALPNGAKGTVMSVFLDAEPLLEVGNPEIIALATRLRGTDTDPRVVAERINRWLYDSLQKRITVGVPSALATLRWRVGDCNEHTQLYVAPSRVPMRIPATAAAIWHSSSTVLYYHASAGDPGWRWVAC